MESPVVLDKPPEYHGIDDRGFPFDEEEGGAWSEFVSRRPELAARLRPHTAAQATPAWARKRRPHSQEQDDFDSFGDFDRLIPEEFRGHFPSHFGRGRFGAGSSSSDAAATTARAPTPPHPATHSTAATQTDGAGSPPPPPPQHPHHLPHYGLRNTVDLGQRSAADPSLVDAEERGARSMSAPPDARSPNDMNAHAQHDAPPAQAHRERRIPIFVEGRDEPIINDTLDFGAPKHNDEPPPTFTHPPNYTRSFGTPFANQFRQGQPFTQQKVFPQNAGGFGRSASPQRTHSPNPHHEEYVQMPVHHEQSQHPRTQSKSQPPHHPPPPQHQQQPPQQQQHHQPPPTPQQQHQPPPPPERQTPPPQQAKPANDPISQILEIQTNVLNLMADVEKFQGTKADKYYLYLDEMLTRNLIRLDDIDAEGKENIRNARKEAVRCIQKCIAVLEAKAESNSANAAKQQHASQDEAPAAAADLGEAVAQPTESSPAATEPPAKEPFSGHASAPTATAPPDVAADQPADANDQPEPMAVDKTADSQMEVDPSASQ